MTDSKLSSENAVLLIENLLLKERFDWQMWDLRQMGLNVLEMKRIVNATSWRTVESVQSNSLHSALEELQVIVSQRDATRVIAGHTHVEQALQALRNIVFGLK
ncbi:MAG TPA: hypothetical protein VJN71_00055 [Nitrososphaerales archaeon]|nr:hypothetical protein [Nitrososphaerales archaeon]